MSLREQIGDWINNNKTNKLQFQAEIEFAFKVGLSSPNYYIGVMPNEQWVFFYDAQEERLFKPDTKYDVTVSLDQYASVTDIGHPDDIRSLMSSMYSDIKYYKILNISESI
jgi:hypothetical protein